MALTLSKLATNTASLSVPYKGDAVNLVYRPGKVTDAVLANIDKSLDDRAAALCGLIVSWDIYQDESQSDTVPLTPDGLSALPSDLKLVIARAIIKDVRPEASAA